ncbi:membrane trafficking regulatory protein [Lithospermum erythrorhizon]|uniref:Membrane trafficking regulatory protein n=1 Tax=Lithospermum erythrorhizon TaxID=34254 RepID=A0AAV3RGP8_LITER
MLDGKATEAQKYVWEGAIPLQIHLHDSEVTTLPPPSTALILAPRIGYLPLLVPQIKPFFSNALPPGVDTVWFEYKGLPLKWYIPTGVLFDLLCAEPERPWNLTVHFRGYPGNILTPCEGEDSVKWSFINSLKEAAYIINGNCKNVMNMSQSDQVELWRSVLNGKLIILLSILRLDSLQHFHSLHAVVPVIDGREAQCTLYQSKGKTYIIQKVKHRCYSPFCFALVYNLKNTFATRKYDRRFAPLISKHDF